MLPQFLPATLFFCIMINQQSSTVKGPMASRLAFLIPPNSLYKGFLDTVVRSYSIRVILNHHTFHFPGPVLETVQHMYV